MKVREEIRNPMNVGQRNIGSARQSLHLVRRQIPELILYGSEVVEDQTAIICILGAATGNPHPGKGPCARPLDSSTLIASMRISLLLLVGCALSFAQTAEPPKYTGPGSCASPSCHGAVQIKTDTSVQQNEYAIWVVKDKHARAFANLSLDIAKRMTRLLNLKSPEQEPRCLACHALDVPEASRARTFDASDGVSCESCHGPASNWLGPHTTKGWTHEQSIQQGMKDLRDPGNRTTNCLQCHVGTKERNVDHELIAAGHPDLYFELASFSAAMPKHWKEIGEKPNQPQDPYFDVRALAAGQAVHLRDQLQRVARNAQGNIWPEYADMDCFACHHSLTATDESWQQDRGYPGRRPGNPPFNMSRFVVLKQVLNEIDPASEQQVEGNIDRLYAMVTALQNDRAQVAALANQTSQMVGGLVPKLTAASYDQPRTLRMMKAILADTDYITRQGERPAEQALMALQSLYNSYSAKAKPANDAQIQEAIAALFKSVENPSTYNAFKFADQMKALGRLLP
jgi:Cytochrome c554 and c-prime